ncbi:MAG: ABC transporter permease [Planctomycetota bacterium]|nr:ABC transporter permease [Planctomycetota bacterium]
MLLSDLIRDVIRDLRKRWLRTGLTMMGIVTGTLLITLMVAIGEGLRNFISTQMGTIANPRLVHVFPDKVDFRALLLENLLQLGTPPREIKDDSEMEAMRRMLMRGPRFLSQEKIEEVEAIEGVVAVWPSVFLNARSIQIDGDDRRWTVHAVPWGWAHVDFLPMESGRRFSSNEASEVILSHQYLDSLGLSRPEELIGRKVIIQIDRVWIPGIGNPLALIDKIPEPIEFEAEVVGLTKRTLFSTAAFVPHARAMELSRQVQGDPTLYTSKKYGLVANILVDEEGRSKEVVKAIKKLDLGARSEAERFAAFNTIFVFINSALSIVGLAALGVAALGIANTLLMSVYERTREIGLYLALGASRKTIRRLFSLEAAIIGLLGGLIGIGTALIAGEVINGIFHLIFPTQWEGYAIFDFPGWLLVGAVLFAIIIATIAGLYPAHRASRLDPISALRYD